MTEEEPLYEDSQIKVTYLHGSRSERESSRVDAGDYELWIKKDSGEEYRRYLLPGGILRILACTSRNDLKRRLDTVNQNIRGDLEKSNSGLNIDSIGMALAQAYIVEQERSVCEDDI